MHKIHFNEETGKHSFYSLREKAWHGYGQISDKPLPSREVIIQSQLDYTVVKKAQEYHFDSGNVQISDSKFYTYRTDNETVLGEGLAADYTVLQNVDAFAFFDDIAKGEGMIYETAGALGHGERIFITAKLPTYITVGNDDVIEKYLFLTSSHDGSKCLTIAFTPVRIVCNNTLNAALANCSNEIKIIHNADLNTKLKEAARMMGIVNTLSPIMEQAFNHWAKTPIKDKELERLIQIALAPTDTLAKINEDKFEECSAKYKNQVYGALGYGLAADSQQLPTTRGTLFGAYNAITGFYQNVNSYKEDSDEKINSILFGGNAQKKCQTAFDLCTQFAKHGASALGLS